jgi:hypothetical protein
VFCLHLRPVRVFACLFLLLPLAAPAWAQYGYHFGRNKIQYEDFDWQVLKTEHFDVYYYPEMRELAEMGAAWAEESYDELENRFEHSLTERTPIVFYASNIHFKQTNITPGFIPDGVGGFFEFLKGRVVIPANGGLTRFRRVIRHELVHVFTYSKLLRSYIDHRIPPDRFVPLWFTEGLAEYWSGEPDFQHDMMLRDALASNFLAEMPDLDRIAGSYLMYKQGEAICRFIAETYGEEHLLGLIENSWRSQDFREVIAFELQRPFDEVADRWLVWLKAQYYPAFERDQVASVVASDVSSAGFSAKPVAFTSGGQRYIVYVSNRGSYTDLMRVPVDSAYRPSGDAVRLLRGEQSDRFEAFHHLESRMDVSAGGTLAFVTKAGERDALHVIDALSGEVEETFLFPDLVALSSPTWSPDGSQLVVSGIAASGFSDLYLFDVQTETLAQLTDDAYHDADPAWSPDGARVAWSSDRAADGVRGAYNLFVMDLATRGIGHVTSGDQQDLSPSWSGDGQHLAFTSARRDAAGRFSAQNLWVADLSDAQAPLLASADPDLSALALGAPDARGTPLAQVASFTAGAFDVDWTADDHLVFALLERGAFSVRAIGPVDSLLADPIQTARDVPPAAPTDSWMQVGVGLPHVRAETEEVDGVPYKRRYSLDLAQGGVSQNAVLGTSGGAIIAFSDLLGDDYLSVNAFSTAEGQGDFFESLNVAVSRLHVGKRTNVGYGLYRYGGRRYDITDPDASAELPLLYEELWGGFGSVSYPISMFQRVELQTSLTYSDRQVIGRVDREALLLSNSAALVHDNALYSMWGPVEGWRGNVTVGYTSDVAYSNVSYYTAIADVRRYWRPLPDVTFAQWAAFRANVGQEARLFFLGGPWDLRGRDFFSVRGRHVWHTSHELRFPIVKHPSAFVPLLGYVGLAGIRGALFADAAHAWNDNYDERIPAINAGETLGTLGGGLRVNLFGALVLRYDLGYTYTDGFASRERFFRQFFFGWDF